MKSDLKYAMACVHASLGVHNARFGTAVLFVQWEQNVLSSRFHKRLKTFKKSGSGDTPPYRSLTLICMFVVVCMCVCFSNIISVRRPDICWTGISLGEQAKAVEKEKKRQAYFRDEAKRRRYQSYLKAIVIHRYASVVMCQISTQCALGSSRLFCRGNVVDDASSYMKNG